MSENKPTVVYGVVQHWHGGGGGAELNHEGYEICSTFWNAEDAKKEVIENAQQDADERNASDDEFQQDDDEGQGEYQDESGHEYGYESGHQYGYESESKSEDEDEDKYEVVAISPRNVQCVGPMYTVCRASEITDNMSISSLNDLNVYFVMAIPLPCDAPPPPPQQQ